MAELEPVPDTAEAIDQARRRSEQRLRELVERVENAGGRARGEVGDADPLVAAARVLEQYDIDEVIVSTVPAGTLRWIGLDLVSRLKRKLDAIVTVVEVEPQG